MLKQTIVWTALPHSSDGPVVVGNTLHFSVLASPRLWTDDPNVTNLKLNQFPDFLDWPTLIKQATFQVAFDGGPTLAATPENVNLRSDLWQALFKNDTDVKPYQFQDLRGIPIQSFPAVDIHNIVKGVYQKAAIDPAFGAGSDLPGNVVLAADPVLRDIARATEPEEPYVPTDTDRGPVVLDEPVPGDGDGDGDGTQPDDGCLGCLLWPINLLRKLLNALGIPTMVGAGPDPDPGVMPTAVSGLNAPPPATNTAFNQLNTYLSPYSAQSVPLPTAQEIETRYDFHEMVASLGDYPNLLRYMGLVVDLVVTLDANLPPATGMIQVMPTLTTTMTTTHYTPKTHYELDDGRFQPKPRPTDPDISNGLLRFQDSSKFQIMQEDVAGSGIKLQNTATSVASLMDRGEWPPNSPDETGLPALQTAGISIVRPEKAALLQQTLVNSVALNLALTAVDGSIMSQPVPVADPPPPPTDELFAEDLVRGIRIDVFDDKSNTWHSLCQRLGTYHFPDANGGPITLTDEEDEGFVQMAATEPMPATADPVMRIHESLFTWDGWSLSAPRPGQTILPDHTTGDAPNTAVTKFQLESSFRAKPGTLPRLRFGYSYRLRARIVDLAGNSAFTPDDAPFANDVAEQTADFTYRRFEPVSPPPLMLRAELIEGESLERLVVRSSIEDAPAAIHAQATERHIVPPKTSQLMSEQHRKFDGTPGMNKDQAAYDLASREAGSMTHKLNLATDTLELIDGIQEVTTPERTVWLQTNEQFELAYLPDPFARGVLLLGLPGMASFDEIIDPAVQIVNKIPFDGAWPDPQPLRLRLEGLDETEASPQPQWDAANRLLTVKLPQGVTADVRISSYFDPADLADTAVWEWIAEANPANLNDLRAQYESGRTWLHLPFRSLVLVHAVQQPLLIPEINEPLTPTKLLGDTAATLDGSVNIDAKSTSKIDLWAKWEDPFDNVSKPAYDETTDVVGQEMHVAEIVAADPANDKLAIAAVLHSLGDTKYHSVTYTPIATSRFREYFPPAITDVAENLLRPTPSEAPVTKTIDIPNSARPEAAKPLYVLPTFIWSEQEAGGIISKIRRGNGLRVYLERPWFSSGAGELLGVVVRPNNVDTESELGQALKPYTSQWGMDPLWQSVATDPINLTKFSGDSLIETKKNLTLAELDQPNVRVHVAGYKPGYDSDRNLWYCDIEMEPGHSYFPFVRLALARFQPISVDDAHLSRVVLADFTQVVPHREVTYDLNDLAANNKIHVKMAGASWQRDSGPATVTASLQMRDDKVIDPNDELGWAETGIIVQLQAAPGQPAEQVEWEGTLATPTSPPVSPLRVVVREYERYEELGHIPQPGLVETFAEKGTARMRLVFADAIIIP
jgi:hypothetical protein